MNNEAIRLSDLAAHIQRVVNGNFFNQTFWVIADISNHSYQHQKGYHFFDLVEKEDLTTALKAKMSASAWFAGSQKIKEFETQTGQKFQNDIRILCQVSVEYHTVYGLKLTLLDLDGNYTLGALEQQKQAVLSRLIKDCAEFIRLEGGQYKTRNQEIKLSRVIQNIAVISSQNSAGFQDFEHTLTNNPYGYRFSLIPFFTLVQGESNADSIRNILLEIFKSNKKFDAVLILRGGGATTDFLIFETFSLGQIVAKFPIPIITGIGHQKNETIVDLMAHTPTKTPTKVAEFILAHNREFELSLLQIQQNIAFRSGAFLTFHSNGIRKLERQIIHGTQFWLKELDDDLTNCKTRVINRTIEILHQQGSTLELLQQKISNLPKYILEGKMLGVRSEWNRMKMAAKAFLAKNAQETENLKSLIRVMSPENILKRGFALLKKGEQILLNGHILEEGDSIEILLYKEELKVKLYEKRSRSASDPDL